MVYHQLFQLKVVMLIRLLRNLDLPKLCNETSLAVKQILSHFIKANILKLGNLKKCVHSKHQNYSKKLALCIQAASIASEIFNISLTINKTRTIFWQKLISSWLHALCWVVLLEPQTIFSYWHPVRKALMLHTQKLHQIKRLNHLF